MHLLGGGTLAALMPYIVVSPIITRLQIWLLRRCRQSTSAVRCYMNCALSAAEIACRSTDESCVLPLLHLFWLGLPIMQPAKRLH